ncbi:Arylsulfatase [Planctomycetes bacterium CA13]|uniref:Arylsulfatase n=1 Tax=Novipirellula herctigrandis TaxID=2527986 RepID=A0A5C5ZCF0_9BACT|nr:Arylsulfatase [Planctomycetes bacterium CA13]
MKLFLTLLCATFSLQAWASNQPNIVIMLADDLGWNAVSYHGDFCDTPNIDSIAAEGLELDRFYVAPMCSPTRAGLLTGRYPIRFGMARAVIPPYRDYGLPPKERTLPEALGEVGYKHRGIFGKWHLGHHRRKWHPLHQGFTHFEGHYNGAIDFFELTREDVRDWHVNFEPSDKQGYSTDIIGDAAAAFIRESAKDHSPYFCYIPWNAPHSPFQAKQADIARYAKGKTTSAQQIYQAMVWSMDQNIGKVLKAIEESGEADNTQVWFLSDNGGVKKFQPNNMPLRGDKLTTFEGGTRVVACVRWPAAWMGGRKIETHIGYIDVLPTVLASAGVDPKAGEVADRPLDGMNVSGILAGTTNKLETRDWYSYHGQGSVEAETISIHSGEWKLQISGPDIRSGLSNKNSINLFHLWVDPLEQNNLANEYPEKVEKLFAKLVTHRKLQLEDAVPHYGAGAKGFVPWEDWKIPTE